MEAWTLSSDARFLGQILYELYLLESPLNSPPFMHTHTEITNNSTNETLVATIFDVLSLH